MGKIISITLMLLVSLSAAAETVYVTDQLSAFLRPEQRSSSGIITPLTSGTKLQLIEKDRNSEYSRVLTERGSEGWILTRHLSSKPVARQVLKQAQGELKNFREQTALLKEVNEKYEGELKYLKEISGNTIAINQRNQQLTEENQNLQNQVDIFALENERLKDESKQDFFLIGAATILLGMVLGLVIPSIKPKRKDTGWV